MKLAEAGWYRRRALESAPNDAEVLRELSTPGGARSRELAGREGDTLTLNHLAWRLATCADPKVRDGQSALDYAEKAVAATKRKNAAHLNTLAAAYAEDGQFAKAVAVQQEAIALLKMEKERKDYASRLRLYQAGAPHKH